MEGRGGREPKSRGRGERVRREGHMRKEGLFTTPVCCHTVDDVQLVDNDSSSLAWKHWIVRV